MIDRKEAEEILSAFRALFPDETKFEIAGSYRRGKYILGDLDVVVEDTPQVRDILSLLWGFQKRSGLFCDIQIDVNLSDPESWGAMLLFATGPGKLNIRMRYTAKRNGLKLNQYGLWRGDNCIAAITEEDIYGAMRLPFEPPEERK